jgi:hypothetical protein
MSKPFKAILLFEDSDIEKRRAIVDERVSLNPEDSGSVSPR